MEVSARLSYARLSPRKVKLAIDLVRGLPISRALQQLKVLPMGVAKPLVKLLASAAANARHNRKVEPAGLWVKRIEVGQGPVLKRYTPRAQGRATPIRRPTAHVNVVLSDEAATARRRSNAA